MTNTIYIHQPEKAFSFTRLPNFLFEAPTFKPLSNEAKVLYAFILRPTELSRKNGWADDCGRIFLYYPTLKTEYRERRYMAKKQLDTNIPQHEIEALARCLLPEIQKFFESTEGQKEFDEWKAQRAKETEKERSV